MFNDLLDKIKDFKYQNYFKNLVKKNTKAMKVNFPVYFNSTAKTVTNNKFDRQQIK